MLVTKRDGTKEEYNPNAIYEVVKKACENLDANPSDIITHAKLSIVDEIETSLINRIMTKSALELATVENPDYTLVAGRLAMLDIHKEVFNKCKTPPSLYNLIRTNIELGLYDKNIINLYTKEEWDMLDFYIDHNDDFNYHYTAVELWRTKYLIRNKITNKLVETPQFATMIVAAIGASSEKETDRIQFALDTYSLLKANDVNKNSKNKPSLGISLPTPIMHGLRTNIKQFSSCLVLSVGDSLDAINAAGNSIVKYSAQRAGIGIDVSRIRAKGSPVRNGLVTTTGLIGFMKKLVADLKSCSQGGVRGGACTIYFPIFHKEIQDLLVLKNNEGINENRIHNSDFGVCWNEYLINRALTNQKITCFCPSSAPKVFELFYSNKQDEFIIEYERAEKDPLTLKKEVDGFELLKTFLLERHKTGRYYPVFSDEMNIHTPFKKPIRLSNLCAEIALPTEPDEAPDQLNGLISLCTLAAVNIGNYRTPSDFEKPMRILVRFLDNILSYQDYPVSSAARGVKLYRPLGIGMINFAYYMAKNDFYNNEKIKQARQKINEIGEAMYYYGLKATVELAKEKGACEGYKDLYYSDGILNIDTYNKNVDSLAEYDLQLDWDSLRKEQLKYGVRNSTLLAFMPSENSSIISNSTNGIEPIVDIITAKKNGDFLVTQCVPEPKKLAHKYKTRKQFTEDEFIDIQMTNLAILQKYVCQSISTNTYFNAKLYPDQKVPFDTLLRQFLFAKNYGFKTLYYNLAADTSKEEQAIEQDALVKEKNLTRIIDNSCGDGVCTI